MELGTSGARCASGSADGKCTSADGKVWRQCSLCVLEGAVCACGHLEMFRFADGLSAIGVLYRTIRGKMRKKRETDLGIIE